MGFVSMDFLSEPLTLNQNSSRNASSVFLPCLKEENRFLDVFSGIKGLIDVLDLQWLGPFGSKNRAFTDVLSSAELASGPTIPLKLSRKQKTPVGGVVTPPTHGYLQGTRASLWSLAGLLIIFVVFVAQDHRSQAGFCIASTDLT